MSVTCPCHGEPWYVTNRQRYCVVKLRANWQRAQARYMATAKGRTARTVNARKRLWIGRAYHSRAASVEQAATIRAHIVSRAADFRTRQKEQRADVTLA